MLNCQASPDILVLQILLLPALLAKEAYFSGLAKTMLPSPQRSAVQPWSHHAGFQRAMFIFRL